MEINRVVVLGGHGFFGRTAADLLHQIGISPRIAGRNPGGDIQVDADDSDSVHSSFRQGDLVLDMAGPFQRRSAAVIEAAMELGYDVIDINDSLAYAEKVLALKPAIDAAGIRVLTSCSSVSTVSASVLQLSSLENPTRLTGFLAPATKVTANRGSALSLIRSVGQPSRVLREGEWVTARGWRESRTFPMPKPLGRMRGRLFESADSILLPKIWPTLRSVDMFVDTNTFGLNSVLDIASHCPPLLEPLEKLVAKGTHLARFLGSKIGGLGYEVEENGRMERYALISSTRGYITPVSAAVLATQGIVEGNFRGSGLLLPHQHVEPGRLFDYLRAFGVDLETIP